MSSSDSTYSVVGEGSPLFLVHGIGASQTAWRFLIPKLRNHFTVITYDLRGHGKSSVRNHDFNLDDLVEDLEELRAKLKIEKAHFAGHSPRWYDCAGPMPDNIRSESIP